MNQDFGKRGNSLDLAVLEIGGIQQPKCTDFVTEPTRSVCAFTWPPSVPPPLHPNLCRQLLGARPKNIVTLGPRNCSQVTGLTFLLLWIKSLYSFLRGVPAAHVNVFVLMARTHYVCVLCSCPGHQNLLLFLLEAWCTGGGGRVPLHPACTLLQSRTPRGP